MTWAATELLRQGLADGVARRRWLLRGGGLAVLCQGRAVAYHQGKMQEMWTRFRGGEC